MTRVGSPSCDHPAQIRSIERDASIIARLTRYVRHFVVLIAGRWRAFFLLSAIVAAGAASSAQDFEASEVRLNRSGSAQGSIGLEPGGRLVVRNSTFREMLLVANYGLSKRLMNLLGDELIPGGPSWIDSDRFDVVAKAAPDATPETVRSMLQSVLVDRFHLAFHREARPLRAYALKASDHVKLQRSSL